MSDKHNAVRLKDLKRLGKQGGATARLEDGTDLVLKPHYAVKQARGYVDGIIRDVEFHLSYAKIYPHIRTIKKDGHLVARKVRSPDGFVLRLTGKGYQPHTITKSERKYYQ